MSNPALPELIVTPASEWRREYVEGVKVQLPSGKVARIRNVSMMLMMKLGRIPDALTDKVMQFFLTGGELQMDMKSAQGIQQFFGLLDGICETCFVEPKVVKEVKREGEIEVDAIDEADKMFLYQLLSKPASELARFHDAPLDMEPVGDEPGHPEAAE